RAKTRGTSSLLRLRQSCVATCSGRSRPISPPRSWPRCVAAAPAWPSATPPPRAWTSSSARTTPGTTSWPSSLPAGYPPSSPSGSATVPPGLWAAPLPLVGLAQDWTWQWHHYLRVLPLCALVLTDRPGVAALARAGISHALPANLYGVGPRFLGGAPGQERDI